MAKIKVISKCELYDGMSITFKAPCDGTAVDGLNVYYNNFAQSFTLRDAHGNNLANLNNLFFEGAYIKAILDTGNGNAYLQNADSSGYLEQNLDRFRDGLANEYVWARMLTEYDVVLGAEADTGGVTNVLLYYSDTIEIVDGQAVLVNPQQGTAGTLKNALDGKYFSGMIQANNGGVAYCVDCYEYAYWQIKYKPVSVVKRTSTEGYVTSPDPNAYPPAPDLGDIQDMYTYMPLGQLGNKMQIASGSYTGTGTYGRNNRNSLTFNFVPKFLLIFESLVAGKSSNGLAAMMLGGAPCYWLSDTSMGLMGANNVSWEETTVSWFNNINETNGWDASNCITYQLNKSGTTYHYIAIG